MKYLSILIKSQQKNDNTSHLSRASAFLVLAMLFIFPMRTFAEEQFRQHASHEHGTAILNVVQENNNLIIEFISPAANIVGFEHEPSSHEQEEAVHQAIDLLEDGSKLFLFSSAAHSILKSSTVTTDIQKHHEKEHGHSQEHANSGHSDFKVEYNFSVQNPKKLTSVEVMLFKHFPAIEHLEVQLLTPTKQTGIELTVKRNTLSL